MEIGGKIPTLTGPYGAGLTNVGSVGVILPYVHLYANLPAATSWPQGTLAFTSDQGFFYVSSAFVWTSIIGIGGGGLGSNIRLLSQQTGVYSSSMAGVKGATTTSLTDVGAIVNAAIAALPAGGELWIDTPVYMQLGQTPTNSIFMQSNIKLKFHGPGMIFSDPQGFPLLCAMNSTNIEIDSGEVCYIAHPTLGSFGVNAAPYSASSGPVAAAQNAWIASAKTYLVNNWGMTFGSTVNQVYNGFANESAILQVWGTADVRLTGRPFKFYVPPNVTADNFIPACMAFNIGWTPYTNVPNGTAQNPSTCSQPTIRMDQGPFMDGVLMGYMGSPAYLQMGTASESIRYSDLQNTLANDPTQAQVGGNGNFFAPPHRSYVDSVGIWPMLQHYKIIDHAQYVGVTTRRSSTSGFIPTGKMEPCFGSTFDMISNCVDGAGLVIANGYANGRVKCYAVCNTTTGFSVNSGSSPTVSCAIAYPSSTYGLINTYIDQDITDTAPVPAGFPIASDSAVQHEGIWINSRCTVQDWPQTAYVGTSTSGHTTTSSYPTGSPSFGVGGQYVFVDHYIVFNNCTSQATYKSIFANNGYIALNDAVVNIRSVGFRQMNMTFVGTSISNGTTVLPALTTAWTQPTGTYPIAFNDGEVRYALFTNNSTAVGNISPQIQNPNGAVTSVGVNVTVGYMGGAIDSYKSRLLISGSGVYQGVHLIIDDATNGFKQEVKNSMVVEETWTQSGSYQPPSGTTYNCPGISFPNTFSCTNVSSYVATPNAFTGPTSLNLGDSGSATRFATGIPVTGASTYVSQWGNPIPLVNSPTTLILTAIGGSYSGAGIIGVGMTCKRNNGAQ